MRINSRIVSATILTLGLLFCSIIITGTWRSVTRSQQTITVVGSAKMDIISDLGVLRGAVMFTELNQRDGYLKAAPQLEQVLAYLESKGVKRKMVEVFPVTQFPNYEYTTQGYATGKVLSYSISQRFQFKSDNVQLIKVLSLDMAQLTSRGVNLQMDMPEFYYTKLADIKINIQSNAARDAQQRAERMAEATGCRLGQMRSAKMGVIQITPKNSNVVSDYGINDVSSVEKEITAVVHTSFEID
jgi:hypothetical protein